MMENTFRKMQVKTKDKDPNKKVQNKIVNLMKEEKRPGNIILVNDNHVLNAQSIWKMQRP